MYSGWTEQEEDDALDAMYQAYEQRSFAVVCIHCGLKATATQSALDKAGWHLGREGEVCQSCIDWDAGIAVGHARALVERIDREQEQIDAFYRWKDDKDAEEGYQQIINNPPGDVSEDCPF